MAKDFVEIGRHVTLKVIFWEREKAPDSFGRRTNRIGDENCGRNPSLDSVQRACYEPPDMVGTP